MGNLYHDGSNLSRNPSITSDRCELLAPRYATDGVIPQVRDNYIGRGLIAPNGLLVVIRNEYHSKMIDISCGHSYKPIGYYCPPADPMLPIDIELIDFGYFVNVAKQFTVNCNNKTNKRLATCLAR